MRLSIPKLMTGVSPWSRRRKVVGSRIIAILTISFSLIVLVEYSNTTNEQVMSRYHEFADYDDSYEEHDEESNFWMTKVLGFRRLSQSAPEKESFQTSSQNDGVNSHAGSSSIRSYGIDNIYKAALAFDGQFGLLHYNPLQDKFTLYIDSQRHKWVAGSRQLYSAFPALVLEIRKHAAHLLNSTDGIQNQDRNPKIEHIGQAYQHHDHHYQQDQTNLNFEKERQLRRKRELKPKPRDLLMAISVGDSPRIRRECLKPNNNCQSTKMAPILHFGSLYKTVFPSMIGMPMTAKPHLPCFDVFSRSYGSRICSDFLPKKPKLSSENVRADVNAVHETQTSEQQHAPDIIDNSNILQHPVGGDGLVFGETIGFVDNPTNEDTIPNWWEALIPQIVWRGTDFSFLSRNHDRPLVRPTFQRHILDPLQPMVLKKSPNHETYSSLFDNKENLQIVADSFRQAQKMEEDALSRRKDASKQSTSSTNSKSIEGPMQGSLETTTIENKLPFQISNQDKKRLVDTLMRSYHEILPRWKGVLLTAQAELEPDPYIPLPWCNIKLSGYMHAGNKQWTGNGLYYQLWSQLGLPAIGSPLDLATLATFKYHIDIGGGGGTTWSGTLEKLAMPGVLFHHVTATKDYYHDELQEWVHYIPIAEDLNDLYDKFKWAEKHPQKVVEISRAATRFAKRLGTLDYMEYMYQTYMVRPIENVANAYVPPPPATMDDRYISSMDIFTEQYTDMKWEPIMECGTHGRCVKFSI